MFRPFLSGGALRNLPAKTGQHLLMLMVLPLYTVSGQAAMTFDASFLSDDPEKVADLSRFEQGNNMLPGVYRADIFLNGRFVETRDVRFAAPESAPDSVAAMELQPCIGTKELALFGIDMNVFNNLRESRGGGDGCNMLAIVPDAGFEFDAERQRLDISLPQMLLSQSARGYIPPEQWDDGIPAALINYGFSGSHTRSQGKESSNYFLNLQSGVNLGAWRLRNYSTASYARQQGAPNRSQWNNVSTYVERAVIALRSQLTLGDSYTPTDIFDSLGFRGAQLASDDSMLPDSLRGFAPVVRGIARGNARVTISQNGYTIYQSYVSPGAFEISDLYPTASSGDLQVSVREADGSVNTFSVPYSAVPLLQREGQFKYAVTFGRFRGNSQQNDPLFTQGMLLFGLPYGLTAYGGGQWGENYASVALGMGKNFGWLGAISADITHALSTLSDGSRNEGQSVRFLYAKSLSETGTNFQLLGYRYSTQGFYTLDESANKYMSGTGNEGTDPQTPEYSGYYNLRYPKRGKVQLNISQQIGDAGSLFITGSRQSYWRTGDTNDLLQLGYNGAIADVNYSLTYSYNRNPWISGSDRLISLMVSLPIGKWLPFGQREGNVNQAGNPAYLTFGGSRDNEGRVNMTAGINGTLLESNNLNYSVQQSHGNKGDGNSGSAGLGYRGGYGSLNLGYNYSAGNRQINYGASGGIVLHANGVTFSQPLGETNVLIKAPGANNVSVENTTGVRTDWRGYAVVPYATVYRENRVALETAHLGDNVDLDAAVAQVVPTKGALVRADFDVRVGARGLFTLRYRGDAVPLGASVTLEDGNSASIVGEEGQVYLSGLPQHGKLDVSWGGSASQRCLAPYVLPGAEARQAISTVTLRCE